MRNNAQEGDDEQPMPRQIELRIDVSNTLQLGEAAHIAVAVVLPDEVPDQPVVCFAKPGGGYSRGYYTCELPGPARGAQADFHASRGWIFVATDNLGSGDSSQHAPDLLTFANCTAAAAAAEEEVLLRLANGVLAPDLPPVLQPVRIGIGQATGGSLAVIQQARYRSYDGVGLLGFSAVHNHPATAPGEPPVVTPWFSRDLSPDRPGGILNASALSLLTPETVQHAAWAALAWSFHYDDVPADVVEQDLMHYEGIVMRGRQEDPGEPGPWNSFTTPHEVARYTLTPGVVAPEAASIAVPVLAAMGERDMIVDPLGEARAFRSAPSFDLFICPRMGHMHNFASTRALFWERIHRFGEWCAGAKARGL